jgi:hypothetical protein
MLTGWTTPTPRRKLAGLWLEKRDSVTLDGS